MLAGNRFEGFEVDQAARGRIFTITGSQFCVHDLDDSLALEVFELARAETEQLAVNGGVVLA
jgi:hypothetical protein